MNNFNVKVFLGLSEEAQERVEHIYAIANELHSRQLPKLEVKDFDFLYDLPIGQLRLYTAITTQKHPAMDCPD